MLNGTQKIRKMKENIVDFAQLEIFDSMRTKKFQQFLMGHKAGYTWDKT